jgi:hypothetical protein
MGTQSGHLLKIPRGIGAEIVRAGALIARPLLRTDEFIKLCSDCGLSISRDRLYNFEKLRIFEPVFRVRTPSGSSRNEVFSIPVESGNDWFEKGWAIDTATIGSNYRVPRPSYQNHGAYYSAFQVDHLYFLLNEMTIRVQLDWHIGSGKSTNWKERADEWVSFARAGAESGKVHEFRRALALLCQYISNRYYPQTQGDQRTINVSMGFFSSDDWISIHYHDWNWRKEALGWNPKRTEELFELDPKKLRHAYEALSVAQSHADPLEAWYQLVQFISIEQRKRLKGSALRAEVLRAGAFMLGRLYKDLYGDDLPHPNEITTQVITPLPELEVRNDTRRYLEFVANRFHVNPQPKLTLIVEGETEEAAIVRIFEKHCGLHPGRLGVEILVLGGVDAATGEKEDRFRAILRLIDYLHHHQTMTYLLLDNERYARKLKAEAQKAASIHKSRRYVTRPEYVKIWDVSYEFDNYSPTEMAAALNSMSGTREFKAADIRKCLHDTNPGAALKKTYRQKFGRNLQKMKLTEALLEIMFSASSRRKIGNRPIIKVVGQVYKLAAKNPFPIRHDMWLRNQASGYLGK